jgi:glycosyltransferase involved in cell wall biosynthesis
LRILFVVPYLPSPIRVRPYNLLRTLLSRGHQITLATPVCIAAEWTDVEHLKALGAHVIAEPLTRRQSLQNCLATLPRRWPLQAAFSWSPALARRLEAEAVYGYDVAHVEHLRGAGYALRLKGCLPVVWDAVDSISHLFAQASRQSRTTFGRWMTRFELPRTRVLERSLPGQVQRVVVSSPVDREAFVSLSQDAALAQRIAVLPNGVDTDYYQAACEPPEAGRLVFTGKLSYHANTTAALHLIEAIMPRVWHSHPDARLAIVGQNPGPALRSAVAVDERLELHANVPDTRPHIQRASVALAPIIYGAGIQNKVLEAMSMSRPLVATSIASSALDASPETDYLLADSAAAFAAAITRLLDDADLRTRLGQNGRRYVERAHQWSQAAARLEQLYADARDEGPGQT